MVRLFTSGAESSDITVEGVTKIGTGTATFDTGTVRSGLAAYKYDSTASNLQIDHRFTFTGALDTTYYAREYIYLVSGGGICLILLDSSNNGIALLSINSVDHTVDCQSQGGSIAISAALSLNTWYLLELECKVVTGGGAASTVRARINGVQFASSTTTNAGSVAPTRLEFGINFTSATTVIYVDDVALNDSTGGSQNTYAGAGRVALLLPTSDNARAALWTAGLGGTTSLFDAVNNAPPIGVAAASETNLTQIKHAGGAAGTTDAYDANMTTYTAAGVATGGTITLVQAVGADGEEVATGTKLLAYSVVSNPAIATSGNVSAGADAGIEGTYPSLWAVHRGTVSYAPTVTLGTAPVMRVVRPETAARLPDVAFMGMLVEYVPPVAVSDPIHPSRQLQSAVVRM